MNVKDKSKQNQYTKSEMSDGKEITGEYSAVLDGGLLQIVKYTAGVGGFHADITYENVDKPIYRSDVDESIEVESSIPTYRPVESNRKAKLPVEEVIVEETPLIEEPEVIVKPPTLKMKNFVFPQLYQGGD